MVLFKKWRQKLQTLYGDSATKPKTIPEDTDQLPCLDPLVTMVLAGVDVDLPRRDSVAGRLPPPIFESLSRSNYVQMGVTQKRRGSLPKSFRTPIEPVNTEIALQHRPCFNPPTMPRYEDLQRIDTATSTSKLEALERELTNLNEEKEAAKMLEDFGTSVILNQRILNTKQTIESIESDEKKTGQLARVPTEVGLLEAQLASVRDERREAAHKGDFEKCIKLCKEMEMLEYQSKQIMEAAQKRHMPIRVDTETLINSKPGFAAPISPDAHRVTIGQTISTSDQKGIDLKEVTGSVGLTAEVASKCVQEYYASYNRGKNMTILNISRTSRTVVSVNFKWEGVLFGSPTGERGSQLVNFHLTDTTGRGDWKVVKMVNVNRRIIASISKWDNESSTTSAIDSPVGRRITSPTARSAKSPSRFGKQRDRQLQSHFR